MSKHHKAAQCWRSVFLHMSDIIAQMLPCHGRAPGGGQQAAGGRRERADPKRQGLGASAERGGRRPPGHRAAPCGSRSRPALQAGAGRAPHACPQDILQVSPSALSALTSDTCRQVVCAGPRARFSASCSHLASVHGLPLVLRYCMRHSVWEFFWYIAKEKELDCAG